MSYAVASAAPVNWNVLSAGGASAATTQVIDQLWPSVFHTGPSFTPTLDTTFVTSAVVTSRSPQTVVYHINPKAVWSDGVAITGADFVYNWEAQSGRAGFTDVGGRPFTPESTSEYSLLRSVTFDPAQPDVVTAVFSRPDPDWPALFAHLVPAHVAERVGFDGGFTDPVSDLVSGGPFLVASYDSAGWVRLVRNPNYWGAPAGVLALDFRFLPDMSQTVAALSADELTCASVSATQSVLSSLRAVRTLSVKVAPGPTYLDLDFRERGGALTSQARRAQVIAAINRPAVVAAAVGTLEPGAAPMANRFLVAGEPGYQAHAAAPAPASGSGSGATKGTGTTAGSGSTAGATYSGPALQLVTGPDPESIAAARTVVAELRAKGIPVTVQTVPSVPAAVAAGSWDIAVEIRPLSPYPAEALSAYISGAPANLDGYTSAAMDRLVREAAATTGSRRVAVINQIDQAAWTDRVDLPLVAIPVAVACQASAINVGPNPAPEGPAYNAASWGISGGGP
jgi:glutathione transport system substrate-binding protein